MISVILSRCNCVSQGAIDSFFQWTKKWVLISSFDESLSVSGCVVTMRMFPGSCVFLCNLNPPLYQLLICFALVSMFASVIAPPPPPQPLG